MVRVLDRFEGLAFLYCCPEIFNNNNNRQNYIHTSYIYIYVLRGSIQTYSKYILYSIGIY